MGCWIPRITGATLPPCVKCSICADCPGIIGIRRRCTRAIKYLRATGITCGIVPHKRCVRIRWHHGRWICCQWFATLGRIIRVRIQPRCIPGSFPLSVIYINICVIRIVIIERDKITRPCPMRGQCDIALAA